MWSSSDSQIISMNNLHTIRDDRCVTDVAHKTPSRPLLVTEQRDHALKSASSVGLAQALGALCRLDWVRSLRTESLSVVEYSHRA